MSLSSSSPSTIHLLCAHLETMLLQIWQETGFGCLELDCCKLDANTTRMVLRGSVHHHYTLNQSDIHRVVHQGATRYGYGIGIENELLARFEATLLQIWRETGFEQVAINSARINRLGKIQVIIRGSSS